MRQDLSDQDIAAVLQRLERFATLTDAQFRIPFTNIRFGIDVLIGFVPVIGDFVSFLMSFYLFVEAHRLGLPLSLKLKMVRNTLLDFGIGLVPFIGDLADIGYRSNLKNLKLIVEHVDAENQKRTSPDQSSQSPVFWLILCVSILGVTILSAYLMAYYF